MRLWLVKVLEGHEGHFFIWVDSQEAQVPRLRGQRVDDAVLGVLRFGGEREQHTLFGE